MIPINYSISSDVHHYIIIYCWGDNLGCRWGCIIYGIRRYAPTPSDTAALAFARIAEDFLMAEQFAITRQFTEFRKNIFRRSKQLSLIFFCSNENIIWILLATPFPCKKPHSASPFLTSICNWYNFTCTNAKWVTMNIKEGFNYLCANTKRPHLLATAMRLKTYYSKAETNDIKIFNALGTQPAGIWYIAESHVRHNRNSWIYVEHSQFLVISIIRNRESCHLACNIVIVRRNIVRACTIIHHDKEKQ